MKTRFLAASAVAITGLIGAFNHGHATPVALDASASSHIVAHTTAATRSPASTAVPNPTTTPTFSSDFSGSSLNTSIWGTCYPWFSNAGCTNFGNGDELEWYLPSQVQVSGGNLNLVAQPVTTAGQTSTGAAETYNCRSGMVTTYPSLNFKYGVVQVVANVPQTYGLWSGIWLLPTNESWPPEIDMEETWGPPSPWVASTFHPVDLNTVQYSTTTPLTAGWHTFTLNWTSTSLTWWTDGKQVLKTTSDIPSQDMYLLLDLADYAQTSTQGCSGTMQISSVKVWAQS